MCHIYQRVTAEGTGLVGIQGGLGDNEGRIDRDASRSRNTARR